MNEYRRAENPLSYQARKHVQEKFLFMNNSAQKSDLALTDALRSIFGYTMFRENQENVVRSILAKRDALVVMPTGGGKSLCYQLPSYILEGTTIVISPLISLMKDQVDAADAMGLHAAFLNSTLSGIEMSMVQQQLHEGELDLLYVSPERFAMPSFIQFLKTSPVSHFAVDEAHCISDWGHDFRPDYLSLSQIVEEFPHVPVSAFTATATIQVQKDIAKRLKLRNPHIVRASFDRENLFYEVTQKENVNHQILDFIKNHKNEPGIVYRTSRKSVEETASFLLHSGISCLPYHAGMTSDDRTRFQNDFNRDRVQVIVATIAFGMGIDKSNIRFIVHGDLPKNMEGFYQETGRAGRDGEPAHCLLFFGRGDVPKIKYFINQVQNPDEQRSLNSRLQDMINYASIHRCRRKQILEYFNEDYFHENCGNCDVCTGTVETKDATVDGQIFLSAIARTEQRFGVTHIIDIITGSKTKKILENGHDSIKTYGAGKDKSKKYWRAIANELIGQGFIIQTDDTYPVLKISRPGIEIIKGEKTLTVVKVKEKKSGTVKRNEVPYNEELFEILRELRKNIAEEQNVAPFIVFSDAVLHQICRAYPQTKEDFLAINGVGEKKFTNYGVFFIKTIKDFIEKNPITKFIQNTEHARSEKSKKIPTHHVTLNLIMEGLHYKAIAEKRGLTAGTIVSHIEKLIKEGHHIDFTLHIEDHKMKEIENLFLSMKTSSLTPVVEAAENITYEEARLARAFMIKKAGH